MPDDLGTQLLNLQTANSQNSVIRQLGEFLAGIPAPEGPSIVGGLRDTGLGLLNLMQFGREGGTLTPADMLSVPVAGGIAGALGGPRGMALAAGGTRNPLGRRMARERSAERGETRRRREAGDPTVPVTMAERQMANVRRREAKFSRIENAKDFAFAKAREGGSDSQAWLNIHEKLDDLLIAGQTRKANRIVSELERFRGRTFRGPAFREPSE